MYRQGKEQIHRGLKVFGSLLLKLGKRRQQRPIQLLFDVSAISRYDMRSGIERVARAQLIGLMRIAPEWVHVTPVSLCVDGKARFCYAGKFAASLGMKDVKPEGSEVEVSRGDLFFSSDFYRDATVQAIQAGVFDMWREKGVKIGYFVHDLLPLSHPEYFPEGTRTAHEQWLKSIVSVSDVLTTNSQVVADALQEWIVKEKVATVGNSLSIQAVQLGFDIAASLPSTGSEEEAVAFAEEMKKRKTFLMVGTIEPRKGHMQVLKAFDLLWKHGSKVNLLIIGSEGWKGLPEEQRRNIPQTIAYIGAHPELNRRLFWLEGVSDELLEKLYANSTALIAASEAEGFGIPLVEAAHHALPVIARDIAVFREVAGVHAFYFPDSKEPEPLADAMRHWLEAYGQNRHVCSKNMPSLSWQESCQNILKAYGL